MINTILSTNHIYREIKKIDLCPNLINLSCVLNRQKLVSIERRHKSWNIEYNFKWNQPYLSHVLNLSRRSNSLNSLINTIYIHKPHIQRNQKKRKKDFSITFFQLIFKGRIVQKKGTVPLSLDSDWKLIDWVL